MNRRRALLATTATTSIADNVFVIDEVYFDSVATFYRGEYYSYSSKIEELYNYVDQYFETKVPHDEPVDTLIDTEFNIPLDIYLYDYKLPIINWHAYETINWREIYFALDSTSPLPNGECMLFYNEFRPFIGLLDGGWTFDHIPEPGMEAIIFVEFAKQMGLDVFKIDNYNVSWREEGKVLSISHGLEEYYVYGAYNDEKTGIIEYHDLYPDGGGS